MKKKLFNVIIAMSFYTYYTIRLAIVPILLGTSVAWATGQTLSTVKVTMDASEQNLNEVLHELESKTDFNFLYIREKIPYDTKVSIKAKRSSLRQVLKSLAQQAHVDFQRVDDLIYVRKSNFNQNTPQKTTIEQIASESDKEITGKVTDAKTGEPLPGVTIIIKGTNKGTITNENGIFNLTVPEGAKNLIISYTGYIKIEKEITSQTELEIQLDEDVSRLDEVMIIGYGEVAKRDVTGSVVKVNSEDVKDLPNVGFDQNLVGKVPGVNIQQTTGTPGGNVSIRIRGTGSISAGNQPLIVIDGYPISDSYTSANVQGSRPSNGTRIESPQNPLNSLNPSDIESIEVLKDASASAIYGSRGANGVIIITTKRGSSGKAKFSLNSYYGTQQVSKTYDMMDAYTFAEQNYTARVNGGIEAGFPEAFQPYFNDELGLVNTDWQDELFRNAPIQNYDLSVRGGSDRVKYFVSGNYFDQEGIILGSGFKRYAFRANLDGKISDRVKISVNLNPSVSESDLVPAENPYFVDGVVNLALLSIPTEPVYNPDGSFNFNQNTAAGSGPFVNPIALATGVTDELSQTRVLGNIKADIEIIKGLTFSSSFGVDLNSFVRDYYRPSWIPVRGTPAPSNPIGRNYNTDITNWISETTLSYQLPIRDHSLNVLAGFSSQKETIQRSGMEATDFPNDLVTSLNAGRVTSGFSEVQEWSLLSYFTRAIYSYKDKYFVNIALRTDGSSRFGNNNKWGVFPSASVGWRVSNEAFFPENKIVNDVKVRASIGVTGNFTIPNYGSVALLDPANYILDDQQTNGLAPSSSPNPDLSWEKTTMTNIGLDLGLLNNTIYLNADYFVSNTEDLLINLPVPGSSGFSSSLQNIGEVQNRGFELGLTGYFEFGDFKWSLNANIATLKNEVTSLGRLNEPIIATGGVSNTHITQVGSPIGSYYGFNALGIFMSEEEISNYPSLSDTQVGDMKWEDVNGDGQITPDDRTITGDYFPDYTFGFSSQMEYKGIDFSFTLQGSQGFEIFHLQQRYLGSLQTFSNYRADVYRNAYISPENPGNGRVYRPNSSPTGDNDAISSYHVEDGSYIRLRNITLGYTFKDQGFFQKLPFDSFRIYVTGQNIFTITDYPGYNPEVSMRPGNPLTQGEDYGTYPLAKSWIFGVNLNF